MDGWAIFKTTEIITTMTYGMTSGMSKLIPISLLASLLALSSWAAPTNVRVQAVTNTQAVIAYTAGQSDSVCTMEVSESPTYSPLVHDVNGTLFPGENLDSRSTTINGGRDRVFVVGKRDIDTGTDTKFYSRALQAYTIHYYRLTCDAVAVTGTFTTDTLPLGMSRTDGYIPRADVGWEGEPKDITVDMTTRNFTWIDPHTGVQARLLQIPGDHTEPTFSTLGATNYISSTNWTNPSNFVTSSPATYATFDGASCAPTCGQILVEAATNGISTTYIHSNGTDWYEFSVTGFGSSATAADRQGEICTAPNLKVYFQANFPSSPSDYYTPGEVCDTHPGAVRETITLPQGSEGVVTVRSKFRVHDYTLHLHGFQQGSSNGLSKPRFIFRKLNGNGTLSIRNARWAWQGSNVANTGSAGEFKRTSTVMRSDGTYLAMTAKDTGSLYSINATSGEIRFLGVMKYLIGLGPQYCNLDHVPFSETDPNTWICQQTTGGVQWGKFTYIGDGANKAQDHVLTYGTDYTVTWIVDNLRDKLVAYYNSNSSQYDTMLGGSGNYARFSIAPFTSCSIINVQKVGVSEYPVGFCRAGAADTPSWQFALNSSGDVIALTPMYATASARWCTNHYQDINNQPVVSVFGQKSGYKTQLAAGIGTSDTTITVTSSCTGDCDNFHTGDPVSYDGVTTAEFLMPMQAGDQATLSWYPALGADTNSSEVEYVKIAGRISPTQYTIIRAQRGKPARSHLTGAAVHPVCSSWAGSTGSDWDMFYYYSPDGSDHSGQWVWDFIADPFGLSTNGVGLWNFRYYGHTSSEHNVFTNGNRITQVAPGLYVMPTDKKMDSTWYQWEPIGFGGKNGIGTGNTYQSHASLMAILTAMGYNGQSIWNAHPFVGGAFTAIQIDSNGNVNCTITDPAVDVNPTTGCSVAKVAGYSGLYRYVHVTTPYEFSPKHFQPFGASGNKILRDISGPGSVINDSKPWTFCHVLAANECITGSTVGQIYALVPDTIEKPFCNGGEGFGFKFDLCIGNVEWRSSGSTQTIFGIQSKTGLYDVPNGYYDLANGAGGIRLLARHALSGGYRRMPGFSSTKPIANGRFALADWSHVSEGTRMALLKIPPAVLDSRNRAEWWEHKIVLPSGSLPAGTDNVIAKFGYVENGTPTQGYCNTRREACIAHRNTVNRANPYSYETSESATIGNGLSCSAGGGGCVLTVPLVPNRIAYVQVIFRNVSNQVILRSPWKVVVAN